MRSLLTFLALATNILRTTAIDLIQPADGTPPKVIQHQIQKRQIANPIQHDLNRRQKRQHSDTVLAALSNEQTLYFMTVSIGNPPQKVSLHIDTGSSDLWVNVDKSPICNQSGQPCGSAGTYSANQSSTYQYVNSDFNISYVDGTGASGDYVADYVKFAGVTLPDQIFGVGYESNSLEGVVGIGYSINEAAVKAGYEAYPNIPANMVENGYINSIAYSLWLDDLESSTGQIVFGGVNTDKYTGQLHTLPIIPTEGVYAEFTIAMTEVGLDGNTGSLGSDLAIGALLDSGTSLMYLPGSVAKKIYNEFGATYDSAAGLAFVDCSLQQSGRTIDFTFSTPTIRVPLSELVLVGGTQNGQPVCILGVGLINEGIAVLGDTFLRSAYVVYDLDNNEISIAQTDFSSTTNNILEIKGKEAIPSATVVQNAVTSVPVISGGAINIGLASTSGNAAPARPTGAAVALLGAAGAAMMAL